MTGKTAGHGSDDVAAPLLRVINGEPTDEDLAALVAVVAARAAGGASEADTEPRSGWVDRNTLVGRTPVVGPGAWTASGRIPGARTRADW
jgi:hypothetical protein